MSRYHYMFNRETILANNARIRRERRDAGLCTACGDVRPEGSRWAYCLPCRLYDSARYQRRIQAKEGRP